SVRILLALKVISSKFPIGVGTRYRRPLSFSLKLLCTCIIFIPYSFVRDLQNYLKYLSKTCNLHLIHGENHSTYCRYGNQNRKYFSVTSNQLVTYFQLVLYLHLAY